MSVRRPVAGLLLMSLAAFGPLDAAIAAPCWRAPVDARVTDPFRAPDCRWCAGNRGIEYGTRRGAVVRAVATGRVTFAGPVAGTVYVVVEHGDGRRVTYGNLVEAVVGRGDLVVRGRRIGQAAGRFHFGLREAGEYVDPAPYLGRLVHRIRLVPVDGSRPNPAPPPRLSCRR